MQKRSRNVGNYLQALVAGMLIAQITVGCDYADRGRRGADQPTAFQLSGPTSKELFHVALTTEEKSQPPVGKYHNWTVSITDNQSSPVDSALVSVTGGMPAHGHGLPTQPRITEYLGHGRYRLEGVRFNMGGQWSFRVHIVTEDKSDTAQFDFAVTH